MNRGFSRQLQMSQRLQSITNFSDELAAPVLTAHDLRDITVRRSSRILKIAAKASLLLLAAISMAAIAALLISASKPALSPAQIIQMEGYQRYHSQPNAAATDLTASTLSSAEPFSAIREIPARVAPPAKLIPVQIVETHFSPPQADTGVQSLRSGSTDRPRMQASKQWSNLRAEPNGSATILASLRINQPVTVLQQSGKWLKVRTDFGQPVTGYMHRSVLAAQR